MPKKFDLSQREEVGRWLEEGTDQAALRAMRATAARLVSHIVTEVIPTESRPPVDRGLYRASWRHRSDPKGAEVYNSSPQAPIIEYSARAANVKVSRKMIDALASWVRRKGIVGKGKGAAAEARGVAFAIAASMRKKGIFGPKGLRILEKASARVEEFFREELVREMGRSFK